MLNIFIAVFFATLSFAFIEPFLFIGYLISIAIFACIQAIFMANWPGGAWGTTPKRLSKSSTNRKARRCTTPPVIGDTVGDPFKQTRRRVGFESGDHSSPRCSDCWRSNWRWKLTETNPGLTNGAGW